MPRFCRTLLLQGSLKTLTLTHNVDLNSPALANAAINHVAYDSLEFSILSTVNYRSPASLFSMSNVSSSTFR